MMTSQILKSTDSPKKPKNLNILGIKQFNKIKEMRVTIHAS